MVGVKQGHLERGPGLSLEGQRMSQAKRPGKGMCETLGLCMTRKL